MDENKLKIKYQAYLLRFLFRDIEDLIDERILSYEEFCEEYLDTQKIIIGTNYKGESND